jgi:cell division protein ZapA
MSAYPVELRVGGQTYRVVSSASEQELEALASVVDAKLDALGARGRPVPVNVWVLVAIALANDLEDERRRRSATEARGREMFQTLLARIDAALADSDAPDAAPSDAAPAERPSTER